jgi:hypothetical protein
LRTIEFVEIMVDDQKQEKVAAISGIKKSPYIMVMDIWERWMRLSDHRVSSPNSHPQDVKEFSQCGEAIDAMVDDLPMIQRHAISRSRSLGAQVWRWPDKAVELVLQDAEVALIPRMKKHLATKRYFGL